MLLPLLVGTILAGTQGKLSAGEEKRGGVAPVADAICPLKVGMTAPHVSVTSVNGTPIDLAVEITKKPTVLIFYRGGWCPFCNAQLQGLQKIESRLYDLGYQLIAVSADKPEKLRETIGRDSLQYTLLSDASMTAAAAFGIAFHIDDATVGRYKALGMDLEGASGQGHHVLPVPAVYVLGTDRIVRFNYVNPNHKVRLDAQLLLRAAEAGLKNQ
jgi:peroxiredoxin